MKARNTYSSLPSGIASLAPPSNESAPVVNLVNIQGDILFGLQKKHEILIFFTINNDSVKKFSETLAAKAHQTDPTFFTTSEDVQHANQLIKEHKRSQKEGTVTILGINIAFSAAGIAKLGVMDFIGDPVFSNSQFYDAQNLGDPGHYINGTFVPDWEACYKTPSHGVFLIAGDCPETVALGLEKVHVTFGSYITRTAELLGNVRPGEQKGHEHFGFNDGLSQPAVKGVVPSPHKGVQCVDPGIILVGNPGDPVATRPAWATDGSFLVFRKLKQLVPEFNTFLNESRSFVGDPDPELLGARMMGRWKSGNPVVLFPTQDGPAKLDPDVINDFNYCEDTPAETKCPYAAHLRKSNPRTGPPNKLPEPFAASRRIIRTGIPYGPELTQEEKDGGKTLKERGLAFICYQSSIANGFQFLQIHWSNKQSFPNSPTPAGFDPIIGQAQNCPRIMTGVDPANLSLPLHMPDTFVQPRGGEYFFSPSIATLKNCFDLVTTTGGESQVPLHV